MKIWGGDEPPATPSDANVCTSSSRLSTDAVRKLYFKIIFDYSKPPSIVVCRFTSCNVADFFFSVQFYNYVLFCLHFNCGVIPLLIYTLKFET